MISEHSLANGFNTIWHDILPMLTPSFVALFNGTYVERLTDRDSVAVKPVSIEPAVTDHGLVAELAFNVALIARAANRSCKGATDDPALRKLAEAKTLSSLSGVVVPLPTQVILSDLDWLQVDLLADVYDEFLDQQVGPVEFAPSLPGSGFLGRCTADLSVGTILYEIKTVTRNFSAHDLRQLFVYLALDYGTGRQRWQRGGFFNPRRATVAVFPVDYVLHRLSGGLAAGQVFDRILRTLADRNLVADSLF